MPKKCYFKPNRSKERKYTAKDAGRIICYARKSGASQQAIIEAAGECLSDYCDCEKVKQIIADILSILAGAALAILVPEGTLLGWVVRLLRFLPQFRDLIDLLEKLPEVRLALEKAQDMLKKISRE